MWRPLGEAFCSKGITMRKSKAFILAVSLVLILSSCATLKKEERPYYHFQGMAKDQTIVITVDALAEKELVASAFGDLEEFAKRATRVSLSLTPLTDVYPLEVDALEAYGVVEGDYPRFLLNTGMMYSRELDQKGNAEGLSWFTQKDGDISLYAPKKDELLFSNASYERAYGSYSEKLFLIDDETAAHMANASIAVYAVEPNTFFDLGLDLPESAFKQMKEVLLLIYRGDDGRTLDAYITMDSDKLANTLSQMVRTGYIARLRKDKISFKIADLMKMFTIENDIVMIKQMDLGNEQMELLQRSLTGLL